MASFTNFKEFSLQSRTVQRALLRCHPRQESGRATVGRFHAEDDVRVDIDRALDVRRNLRGRDAVWACFAFDSKRCPLLVSEQIVVGEKQ